MKMKYINKACFAYNDATGVLSPQTKFEDAVSENFVLIWRLVVEEDRIKIRGEKNTK